MSSLLNGMLGVIRLMDVVLLFGKSQAEHDTHLLIPASIALNTAKLEFSKLEL